MFAFLKKIFGSAHDRLLKRYRKIVDEVNQWEEKYQSLSDDEIRAKTDEFRQRIQAGETVDQILPEAYAVVKNTCRRLVGSSVHVSGYDQPWDMVPYDVQILGAVAMHKGAIAEMQTGEGKTLTAVMPLYLNALTGSSVHLVTVNDYLAARDCEWVGAILRWLGLTTGALTNDVPPHERQAIYNCDVIYGTASEFGFDYLRDNSMAMREQDQVQRDHYFAIVDEIDSILIDEARTPLIISGPVPESKQLYDELKGGVGVLVRMQRDICNRYASDAKKVMQGLNVLEDEEEPLKSKLSKEQYKEFQDACHKLWLVKKGTPRHKVLRRMMEHPDIRAAIDEWDIYYFSDQNKEEKAEVLAQLLIIIDERSSEYELTDKGIHVWAEAAEGGHVDDFTMLDLGDEYHKIDTNADLDDDTKMAKRMEIQELDGVRKERAHNLRQLLRAHLLMERDVDYIVQEGKIVIIDEHTGRAQPGRRFSDGLHQAIEAKEGVTIQKETQTYATITLQNYFRMYDKLAGMTGTAATEAGEFKEIYKLDVLEIPTNKPNRRDDANDEIYMTEREKYNAILAEVREVNGQGRPILIGTETVEVSEKLSRIFKQNKIEHTVLNAKHHDQEAAIVAQAGQKGSVTISTNMAGRGTDIKLGEGCADLGGLHVLGTTRHQSRRIDRQLRGRCARQGDPGTSKFYVSFEDSLMRLFASPKLTAMLQRFRPPEGEPISAGILNRSIETAQKRVEQRNYMIRKHTLEYDDVMNKQRQEIYEVRNQILHIDEIETLAEEMIEVMCESEAEIYFRSRSEEGGWDPDGYRQWLCEHFPVSIDEGTWDDDHTEFDEIWRDACDRVKTAFREKLDFENRKILEGLPPGSPAPAVKPASEAVRSLMLRKLDQKWQEHLLSMDHLRSEVSMRTVAQRDPLLEFKHEAFELFDKLSRHLRQDIAQSLFRFQIVTRRPIEDQFEQLMQKVQMEKERSLVDDIEHEEQPPSQAPVIESSATTQFGQPAPAQEEPAKTAPVTTTEPKIKRNDPCPCGSGKKYKKCCGAEVTENA